MNKKLRNLGLVGLLVLNVGVVSAQINPIPNGGFENWEQRGSVTEEPSSWETTNAFTNNNYSTVKVSPGYKGNYAAKIKAIKNTNTNQVETGVAYAGCKLTQKPIALTGYCKTKITTGDSVSIRVDIYSSNSLVGSAVWSVKTTSNTNWSFFSKDITYTSSNAPDSAFITILGGDEFASKLGTELTLDELAFDGSNTLGLSTIGTKENTISVSPNPTTGLVTVILPVTTELVTLYSLLGEKVYEVNNASAGTLTIKFDELHLNEGMYILSVRSGQVNKTAKLVYKK